jgi:hypothetical protein
MAKSPDLCAGREAHLDEDIGRSADVCQRGSRVIQKFPCQAAVATLLSPRNSLFDIVTVEQARSSQQS